MRPTASIGPDPMSTCRRALVLTGGGARGAYQVGVLKALAEWVPPGAPLPFRIVCGTSAGAIIGSILATHAGDFRSAVQTLEQFWGHFRVRQVWRNDLGAVLGAVARWLLAVLTGGVVIRPPHSLFDNSPLRQTLRRHVDFRALQAHFSAGTLDALAVVAAPYAGTHSRVFYQCREPLTPACGWADGTPVELGLEHLMASAAVPILFPSVQLPGGYYGDGALRQTEPLSPAINLGADRVLAISVRPARSNARADGVSMASPSAGQIIGYMLDTVFMAPLRADVERLERDNRLIRAAGAAAGGLRVVDPLLLEPSADPAELAGRHVRRMPFGIRLLMRTLGAANAGGGTLLSYLLFDGAYARDLIALGYADAQARREELQSFLSSDR